VQVEDDARAGEGFDGEEPRKGDGRVGGVALAEVEACVDAESDWMRATVKKNKGRDREGGARTEDEDKCPCAVTHEEVYDGGASPAEAESNEKLVKSEEKKDRLERNKSDAESVCVNDGLRGKEGPSHIRKVNEPWWGMNDDTDVVEADLGNNADEGDDHDDILHDVEEDENRSDDAASVIQSVNLEE